MSVWIEYNFEEFTFRNGAAVLAKNWPRMLYNERDQSVAIYGLSKADHAKLIANSRSALKDIFYFLRIFDGPGGALLWEHRFRHPFPAGTFVCVRDHSGVWRPEGALSPDERALFPTPKPTVFISNSDGKKLFGSNFTAEIVSDGEIKDRTRAFQFLEK